MQKMRYSQFIGRIKWQWIFAATSILYLVLIFLTPVMPTLDGAMHLHNASMLGKSFSEGLSSTLITQNPAGWINAADHLLLLLLTTVVSAGSAQKLLLGLLFVSGACGWWRIHQKTDLNGAWSLAFFGIWMGWPWFMGFFNFLLASTLLIWLVPLILNKNHSRSSLVILTIGVTVLAGLHLYVFATAGLLVVCQLLSDPKFSHRRFRHFFSRLLPFLPGSIFLVVMLGLSDSGSRELAFSSLDTKFSLLFSGSVLKGLDPGKEDRFVFWTLLAIVTHLVWWLVLQKKSDRGRIRSPYFLMIAASTILLLLIPDHVGAGSFLPYRVVFFLFLFLFLWLATHKTSPIHSFVVMVFLTIGNVGFLWYYAQALPPHGQLAEELIEAGETIEEGAVVLSLTAEAHWMHEHYSAYLGLDKELILLDNYELSSGAFPLKLSTPYQYMTGEIPVQAIPGNTLTFPQEGPQKQIDYVLLITSDSTAPSILEAIRILEEQDYSLFAVKPGFQLYSKE